jgi:hypothetical protein
MPLPNNVVSSIWLSTHGWKLNKPRHKEGEKSLRSDIRAVWECVLKVLPRATEDATKHNGEQIAGVEGLNTVPDDADDSSDEDKEVSSVHSHDGSCKDGAAIC